MIRAHGDRAVADAHRDRVEQLQASRDGRGAGVRDVEPTHHRKVVAVFGERVAADRFEEFALLRREGGVPERNGGGIARGGAGSRRAGNGGHGGTLSMEVPSRSHMVPRRAPRGALPAGWATVHLQGWRLGNGLADGSGSRCSRRPLHAGRRDGGGRVERM